MPHIYTKNGHCYDGDNGHRWVKVIVKNLRLANILYGKYSDTITRLHLFQKIFTENPLQLWKYDK